MLDVRLDTQSVLLETSLGAEQVKELLESSGRRAVLKGMGGSMTREYHGVREARGQDAGPAWRFPVTLAIPTLPQGIQCGLSDVTRTAAANP